MLTQYLDFASLRCRQISARLPRPATRVQTRSALVRLGVGSCVSSLLACSFPTSNGRSALAQALFPRPWYSNERLVVECWYLYVHHGLRLQTPCRPTTKERPKNGTQEHECRPKARTRSGARRVVTGAVSWHSSAPSTSPLLGRTS